MARKSTDGEPDDPTATKSIHRDDLDAAHVELVTNHPGFQSNVQALAEELGEAGLRPIELFSEAQRDPEEAPYPVRTFSEQWGLTPAFVLALVFDSDDPEITEALRMRSRDIQVWDAPMSITIRIPKPITDAKRHAGLYVLTTSRFGHGAIETARATAGKSRQDVPKKSLEILPFFLRWNDGDDDLLSLWSEFNASAEERVTDEAFVKRLRRMRDRLKEFSPEGIRLGSMSVAWQRRRND